MSEKLSSHEQSGEQHYDSKEHGEKIKSIIEKAEKAEHKEKNDLETIRQSIEKETKKQEQSKSEQAKDKENDAGTIVIDRTVKRKAYKKELKKVQSQLPAAQRSFSKIIHNKTVENISEVGAKTVARPSGILGGSLVALLGSTGVLLMSRHYGFEYNFFVFIALLIGGYFVGLILEMLLRLLFKKHSS